MDLLGWVKVYVGRREVSGDYVRLLESSVRDFAKFAQRKRLEVFHLDEDLFNSYILHMRERGASDTYRKSRRAHLLALWNSAADEELIDPPNMRKIVKVKVADRFTEGWSMEEVIRLINATVKLRGFHPNTRVKRERWWRSYIMAAWDTGLRGCDLRRIRYEDIRQDGLVRIVQSKTGKRKTVKLWERTMMAIEEAAKPRREFCWPLWGTIKAFSFEANKLIKMAELKGSLKYLRSGSGTAVEAQNGRGHEHLGNTRKVFEQHYRVDDMLDHIAPMPPQLPR